MLICHRKRNSICIRANQHDCFTYACIVNYIKHILKNKKEFNSTTHGVRNVFLVYTLSLRY